MKNQRDTHTDVLVGTVFVVMCHPQIAQVTFRLLVVKSHYVATLIMHLGSSMLSNILSLLSLSEVQTRPGRGIF